MEKRHPLRARALTLLVALLALAPLGTWAQKDYTRRVDGADCDDAQYWHVEGISSSYDGTSLQYVVPADDGGTARLVCDTWSGRGSRDGSDMTPPFMEYHRQATAGQVSHLPDAQIRHQTLEGLPAGTYKISMRVRVYAEQYSSLAPMQGVRLYANGTESADLVSGRQLTAYGTGRYVVDTYEVSCQVGDDGQLSFGLNVSGAGATELNWVAWKGVKLTYLGDGTLQEGDYYLRNRQTGQWLEAGGTWGTQGTGGSHGSLLTATRVTSGSSAYYLTTEYDNNGLNHLEAISDQDCTYFEAQPTAWTIEYTADGYCTLRSPQGYLGATGSEAFSISLTDPSDPAAQWEAISPTERIQRLLDGTETDATFLISDPRFDRNFADPLWTGGYALDGINSWTGYGNQVAEVWGGSVATISLAQTLENLPNGRYQLSVQGFFRYNDDSENSNLRALETHTDGTEQLLAQLYARTSAGEQAAPLPSIASEVERLAELGLPTGNYGMPYSMYEGGLAFRAGLYAGCQLTIDVTDHRLTLGIRKDERHGCDWTLWDNFELTLLSPGDNTGYQPDPEPEDLGIDFTQATPDTPVDCTALIKNPDFNSASGWKGSPSLAASSGNTIASHGGTGVARATYSVSQTLTGLPAGLYRLKAQGFYRYGDVVTEEHNGYGGWNENSENDVWATYTIPYATITRRNGTERLLAQLYANDHAAPLPSIFDGASDTARSGYLETEFGWVPNTTAAAADALLQGDYPVELLVPVCDGTLTLGVRKPTLGYKYDWTCFDRFQLEYLGASALTYATTLQLDDATPLSLSPGQQVQLSARVLPADATDRRVRWTSSDASVLSVTDQGLATALAQGTATLCAETATTTATGSHLFQTIPVTVGPAGGDASRLVINEIQVSNLDQFLDPSGNYGGWIELYNPGSQAVDLNGFGLSDGTSHTVLAATRLVPAQGYQTLFFDHNAGEVGNSRANAGFKLDMDGGTISLYDTGGTLVATATYPAATARTSYARIGDGSEAWGVTASPTPAASNSLSREFLAEDAPRLPMPTATPSGFYAMQGFRPDIQGEGTILCTLDGSLPTEENGIPAAELPPLDGTTVLRMRAFQSGSLPSPVATYTYSADGHAHTLPVLLVAADPAQVYSDSLGIFVTGTAGVSGSGIDYPCNWNNDWDRAAHMQLLSPDGTPLFQQEVNLSRFGGWSRSWFPYNFKLKAQKQYEGRNYLEYPFFTDNKPYLRHKVLQVRNGGNDVSCRIKDAALHQIIIRSGFRLDCLDCQPVHCYINGRYCGMQNLREPSNKHYGLADYGIDTDEMDAMEITWGVTVKAGSASDFYQWRNLTYSAADDEAYRQICQLVDVQEFANYFAAQLYLGGDDWPGNNCKGFKGSDGKFHIVFFDVDQALRFDRGAFSRLYQNQTVLVTMLQNMMQNDTFRKLFIDSYCLFGGSVMQPQRCHDIIDELSARMNPALALEGLSTSPTADYMKRVLSDTRRETMLEALKGWEYAQLGETRAYRLKLSADTPGARLQVNGADVPMAQFDGTLFAPSTLTALAPQGYRFAGWRSQGTLVATAATLDLATLGQDAAQAETLELTARFQPLATDEERLADLAMPVKVNEVSAGNTVFASETWKRDDWVELYNTTDTDLDAEGLFLSDDPDQPMKWQVRKPSEACNTLIPAHGHLIVWADGIGTRQGQQQLHATFKLANADRQTVVAVSGDEFVDRNAAYFDSHPAMAAFIDGLTYDAHRGDQTTGRYPDGGKTFYRMERPTPERANQSHIDDQPTGTDQSLMQLLPDGFTLQLAEGWNWVSHPLHTPLQPAELSAQARRIVGQKAEATRSGTRMVGTLNYLDATHLYKVQMQQADTYRSERQHAAQPPISLQPGWNWVGYPVDGAQPLATALAAYLAEEGDKLVGQDGFATYTGGQWAGTLTTLETGKGYMLQTQRAKTFTFQAPRTAIRPARQRKAAIATPATRYGFSKTAHPNVMGIIATLALPGGTPAEPDAYTLLAYSGDECRGAAQWLGDRLYLTAYGQGGEPLRFLALREADGTLLPVTTEDGGTLAFAADVEGTPQAPLRLTLGTGDDATDIPSLAHGTHGGTSLAADAYYSLSGQRLATQASRLTPGVYILRQADGSFRKVQVK